MIRRTLNFDEYKKKITEGVEEIGFKTIPTVREYEEESIDSLGEGEKVDVNPTSGDTNSTDDVEPSTDEKQKSEEVAPVDTGKREDLRLDEIKTKMDYITGYIQNIMKFIKEAESKGVDISKVTKEKVVNLFNFVESN